MRDAVVATSSSLMNAGLGAGKKVALETESQTYQRELSNLLIHAGKFVLIHGDAVVDVFDSYDDALKAGYKDFGLEPFMVKKIQSIENVHVITRLIAPCPI